MEKRKTNLEKKYLMFGMKKRKRHSFKNIFKQRFIEAIKNSEYREYEPQYIDHSLDGIPLLPEGQTNPMISNELLFQLPQHLRRWSYWSIIDLKLYFEEEPDSPNNSLSNVSRESEKPLDVFNLNEKRKAKLKAIALNEVKEQREDEDKEEEKS